MLVSASCRLQLYFPFSESLQSIFPHGIPQMKIGHCLDASNIHLSRHSIRFILNKTQQWSEDLSRSLFSISSASHIGNTTGNPGVTLRYPRPTRTRTRQTLTPCLAGRGFAGTGQGFCGFHGSFTGHSWVSQVRSI